MRDIMFTLHTDGFCPELSNYRIGLFSHGASRRVTVLLSRIIELSNFFSHGESRRVSGFMSRIIELSNLFSHGESRRFSLSRNMFLDTNLRDLSFGPTDQREVICELVSSHGMSRIVVEVMRVEL